MEITSTAGNGGIVGSSDNDGLNGADTHDRLEGGAGNDQLHGDAGFNHLFGHLQLCVPNRQPGHAVARRWRVPGTLDTIVSAAARYLWPSIRWASCRPCKSLRLAGIDLHIVRLPKRWAVERSFARISRFRRLVRDAERLYQVPAGSHFIVFAILMPPNAVQGIGSA